MTPPRNLIANMYWYIRALLENNGFRAADYTVLYAYPSTVQIEQYPTVAIDRSTVRKDFFQLSGPDITKVSLVIDVLGNSRDQKEDISSVLQDYFHERALALYDFSSLFPTTVGDYTGIPSLGQFYVDSVSVVTLHPPQFSNVPAEKFHDMIIMDVSLPS